MGSAGINSELEIKLDKCPTSTVSVSVKLPIFARICHTVYFNFNLIQRALVLEDYAPALGVAGFVSRKKGARSKGKEEKEGKIIIIVGKMIIYM